jgi:hypothetical protein
VRERKGEGVRERKKGRKEREKRYIGEGKI